MNRPFDAPALASRLRGLYVLTDEKMGGGHLAIARAALKGGARIIQLRDKSTDRLALLPVAHELRILTQDFGALLIINDDLTLCGLCAADGVHLGPDDVSPRVAREQLGENKIIGVSCGTPGEASAAEQSGATYIGIGAVFGTQTKLDAGAAIGLDGLKAVLNATRLPGAAIGGVDLENIALVRDAGAPMACVVSAVARAADEAQMEAATRALVERFGS